MSIISNILGNSNEKYLKSIQPLVSKINSFESELGKLSDENLKERAAGLRNEVKNGKILDDILPEAFALTREAAKRTLGQRHFDTQLLCGIALHQGEVAQMLTGEGKTLASTAPAFLNGLTGKGVHIVTVNDYLSRRDAVWMGQIYYFLGLTVGCLSHEQSFLYDPLFEVKAEGDEDMRERDKERDTLGSFKIVESFLRPVTRKEAYLADIVYGTNNEFGFDYLRDNLVYDLSQMAQRGFYFAILDEVDSILIDEARTPLIISAPDTDAAGMYRDFSLIIPRLSQELDYEVDEKLRTVNLTEKGVEKVEKLLNIDNIYDQKGIKYLHHLEQALRAQAINPSDKKPLFSKDRDYVVKAGEVIIVDEFTGRLMPGRRWSGGLHQAIEAKEGVEVKPESITLATITFQNFFRMYEKLAGMTGTAATSAEEFDKVYKLEVALIPTNKPMVRKDRQDRVYKSEDGKFKAIVEEIKQRNQKGQPLLVGTRSIEKNEFLSRLLEREGIKHEVLNAKYHEREAQIIAQAGRFGAVTVATNMAGRGVDIILSGNPPDAKEADKVKAAGGLFVLGTERHEARRIDDQLRGRSGRQGDPGESQFFVSLEDELMRVFGGDRIKSLMERLNIPDDQPIENGLVSSAIESAQKRIEGFHLDARSHVLEYDDVINKQRDVIYKKRKEILSFSPDDLRKMVLLMVERNSFSKEDYFKKEEEIGKEEIIKVERILLLRNIDYFWMNHLTDMEHLMDSVKLRGYAHFDPLVEYKNEGNKMFKSLLSELEIEFLNMLFKISLKPQKGPLIAQAPFVRSGQAPVLQNAVSAGAGTGRPKKPGRNDPCPCGKINPQTGKPMKYKKCHGK